MAIQVVGNTTAATAVVSRPRLSVAVVDPRTSVSYTVPAASISYVELVLGAYLDTTGRFLLVQDAAVMVESVRLAFGKPLFSEFGVADASAIAFERPVSGDEVAISDVLTKLLTYARSFSDAQALSDAQVLDISKAASDVATMLEAKSISFSRPLADTQALDDRKAVSFTKPVADTQGTTDASQFSFVKRAADTQSLIDAVAHAVQKQLFEATQAQDIATLLVSKLIADGFAMNDAFDTGDGSVYSFAKGVSNVTIVGDAAAATVSKPIVDAATASDTGLVLMQGYAEFGYFLEDYVGASRAF